MFVLWKCRLCVATARATTTNLPASIRKKGGTVLEHFGNKNAESLAHREIP